MCNLQFNYLQWSAADRFEFRSYYIYTREYTKHFWACYIVIPVNRIETYTFSLSMQLYSNHRNFFIFYLFIKKRWNHVRTNLIEKVATIYNILIETLKKKKILIFSHDIAQSIYYEIHLFHYIRSLNFYRSQTLCIVMAGGGCTSFWYYITYALVYCRIHIVICTTTDETRSHFWLYSSCYCIL